MVLFRAPLLALVLATAALAACGDGAPPSPAAPASEAAALLDGIDAAAFRDAFADSALAAYTRTTRTTEWNVETDEEVAVFERTVRVENGQAVVLEVDTSGTFSSTWLGAGAPDDAAGQRNLAADVLPDDAPFFDPRNRDAYRRTLLADTLIDGRATRVVAVDAVPGEGDGQAIRQAHLYVDAATGALVALRTVRASSTLLFDEHGTAFLATRRLPDGRRVPDRIAFETELDAPLTPPRRFTSERTYRDVVPLASSGRVPE